MTITTEEAEQLATVHDWTAEDEQTSTGLRAGAKMTAAALRSIAAERDALRAALRGVLAYYNAPTPAEAKLKKAVLATPIEQARAALGEKE